MLDVEFLLGPPSSLDRSLIYRYRSGNLRTPLKKILHALAERDDCVLVQCAAVELPSFCAGGTLFPSVALCDLPAPSNGRSAPDDILTLQALSSEGAKPAILFVEERHPVVKHPGWPIATQASLFVEEAVVTASTVGPVLKYLVRQSEFVRNRDLLDQDEFRSYFDELIAERDGLELPDFKQEFDRTVLLHVDPKTGRFLGHAAIRKQQVNPNRIMQPLRGLVERTDPLQLSDLLRGLAVRFPSGRTGREVADELARHAQNLFKPGVDHQPRLRSRAARRGLDAAPGYDAPKTNVWLWSAIVLAFTPRLFHIELQEAGRRPVADLSLVTVDQMGREFLRRMAQEDEGDPLCGLWPELKQVILGAGKEGEKEITVQGKLIQLLKLQMEPRSLNEPRWISSLRMILADDCAAAARQTTSPDETAKRPEVPRHLSPQTFADVIGQQATVDGICRRLQRNDSTPLILYGPEGVGKRTLGRLYAKGLLCEAAPAGSAVPCGCCEPCLQFDAGEVLDYIEFDAGAPHAVDYVRQDLLRNLQYASFSRHRPVLIANPDKSPRLVDMCLKTLETHSQLTRFIFTVSDIRAMSDTARSRCEIYRISHLDNESARSLGARFMESCSLSAHVQAIDLLVAEANGLPHRLLELSAAISSSNATTIGQVRGILGLDWVADAISLCRSLFSPPKADEGMPQLPPAWHCGEAVLRIRLVLAEIYCVHQSGKIRRSAFLHLAGDPINELALALRDRATEIGVSFRFLWAAISQHWAADHLDFRSAWWEARALMRTPILA